MRPGITRILSFCIALLVFQGMEAAESDVSADNKEQSTVLITGSNRGLGLEFARQYAELGWKVIATCRKPTRADALKAIAAEHSNLVIERLDVTDHQGIDALARKYQDQPVDVLLNNAAQLGPYPEQEFGSIDYDFMAQAWAVNAMGPLKVAEAFHKHVAASRQKRMVFLGTAASSNGFLRPEPQIFGYRSSKAGLHLIAHHLGLNLANEGIAVMLVNPGLVDTRGFFDRKPGDPVPEPYIPLLPLIESGQLELIRPSESVRELIGLIAKSSPEDNTRFINYDGTEVPW